MQALASIFVILPSCGHSRSNSSSITGPSTSIGKARTRTRAWLPPQHPHPCNFHATRQPGKPRIDPSILSTGELNPNFHYRQTTISQCSHSLQSEVKPLRPCDQKKKFLPGSESPAKSVTTFFSLHDCAGDRRFIPRSQSQRKHVA
jgi:hypothetical protein